MFFGRHLDAISRKQGKHASLLWWAKRIRFSSGGRERPNGDSEVAADEESAPKDEKKLKNPYL